MKGKHEEYRAAVFSCKNFGPMLATSCKGVSDLRPDECGDCSEGGDGGHVELEDGVGCFHDRHRGKHVKIIDGRNSAGVTRERRHLGCGVLQVVVLEYAQHAVVVAPCCVAEKNVG